jgi:hypothetical protein
MTTAWANRLIFLANVALAGFLGYWIATRGLDAPDKGWNPVDLITIILTATTVVLAAVAFGVALMGIWGYKAIVERAEQVAKNEAGAVALKKIDQYLDSANIRGQLEAQLNSRVSTEADKLAVDLQGQTILSTSTGTNEMTFEDYPPRKDGEEAQDAR